MSSGWKATAKKTRAKSSQPMFKAAIRLLCMLYLPIFTVLAILNICAHCMGGCIYREHPVNAAVLHLAKGITVEPSIRINPPSETPVQQNGSEFYACGIHSATTENTTSRIDLLNYNRCVAQAMIVAMNANEDDAINSLIASLHAESVHHDLDEFVRTPLEGAMLEFITEKSWVENNPSNIFFEPNEYCDLLQSRFHAEWASNVVIADKVLSGAIPVSDVGTHPFDQLACTKDKFIAGYSGIKIDDMIFEFVPVCPGSKPHLVSTDDFLKGMEANSGAPPNAFGLRMKPTKRERYANVWSYPMAAAVIGDKVKGQQHVEIFTASIPGGYIELRCHQMDGVPKVHRSL